MRKIAEMPPFSKWPRLPNLWKVNQLQLWLSGSGHAELVGDPFRRQLRPPRKARPRRMLDLHGRLFSVPPLRRPPPRPPPTNPPALQQTNESSVEPAAMAVDMINAKGNCKPYKRPPLTAVAMSRVAEFMQL